MSNGWQDTASYTVVDIPLALSEVDVNLIIEGFKNQATQALKDANL
mgnify:CR=1 FL=1